MFHVTGRSDRQQRSVWPRRNGHDSRQANREIWFTSKVTAADRICNSGLPFAVKIYQVVQRRKDKIEHSASQHLCVKLGSSGNSVYISPATCSLFFSLTLRKSSWISKTNNLYSVYTELLNRKMSCQKTFLSLAFYA